MPAFAADPQVGTGETDGYTLVWQDLFDAPTLNKDIWNIEVNDHGGGNNELQYYTDRPENVCIANDADGNSCLVLTGRREDYKTRNFTSGRVNSLHNFTFTHGKIEAAIKLPPTGRGLWPAFWLMGDDIDIVSWPACGEIDIMEMGLHDAYETATTDRLFNGAAHWGSEWPQKFHAEHNTWDYSLQDGQFHLFTLFWDENSLKMYVDLDRYPDAKPYYQLDITANAPDDVWSPGNYFHKPHFILFNLAVGGNFPDIHTPEALTALNDANGQQAPMYINYVKVYQKSTEVGKNGN